MENPFKIVYSYRFKSGLTKTFDLLLDGRTLGLIIQNRASPPAWTNLEHARCGNCPKEVNAASCPIALNFADIADQFKDMFSYENVTVTVTTEQRTYSKDTTIQHGLSPLIGIIMTTSGCPIMDHLKPMVRFHLPFASLDETIFRMVSMHLLVQYYRNQDGKPADWTLDGLVRIYGEVSIVNRDFAVRLRDAAKKDANINALVNLDCFAAMLPLAAEDSLQSIKPYFSAYFKEVTNVRQ